MVVLHSPKPPALSVFLLLRLLVSLSPVLPGDWRWRGRGTVSRNHRDPRSRRQCSTKLTGLPASPRIFQISAEIVWENRRYREPSPTAPRCLGSHPTASAWVAAAPLSRLHIYRSAADSRKSAKISGFLEQIKCCSDIGQFWRNI